MLYDLIKSHAALFFMQRRQKTSEGGTSCVYADEKDFAAANECFHAPERYSRAGRNRR